MRRRCMGSVTQLAVHRVEDLRIAEQLEAARVREPDPRPLDITGRRRRSPVSRRRLVRDVQATESSDGSVSRGPRDRRATPDRSAASATAPATAGATSLLKTLGTM